MLELLLFALLLANWLLLLLSAFTSCVLVLLLLLFDHWVTLPTGPSPQSTAGNCCWVAGQAFEWSPTSPWPSLSVEEGTTDFPLDTEIGVGEEVSWLWRWLYLGWPLLLLLLLLLFRFRPLLVLLVELLVSYEPTSRLVEELLLGLGLGLLWIPLPLPIPLLVLRLLSPRTGEISPVEVVDTTMSSSRSFVEISGL